MSESKAVEAQAAASGVEISGPSGIWGWLLQRVSAALLVLVLGIHLWVLHFADEAAVLSFAGTTIRLRSVSYLLVDCALLGVALYHGLYGLRSVLLDYVSGIRARRFVSVLVWLVGLAAFIYGGFAFTPFLRG